MNAYKFIQEQGLEKAKAVVDGMPDKTATHWVGDTDTYFAEEFHTYFDHGFEDWETTDLHCVYDIELNYEVVICLDELKQAIADLKIAEKWKGYPECKKYQCMSFHIDSDSWHNLKDAIHRIEQGLNT